ncbi:hypothetical protein ABXT60_00825 [Candidatus Njordibacter sp. Uisw_056]|jgi:hypothetical protein|uniref:hypothetical protein n=1 Tax=Candidatus Njordibacter sp. Uisw_056 TaxID=3230973 RepID=UPI003D4CB98F|tara:strand:- start:198 stop:353 length:156 start_codon:yes stop_codon:yes gene_type:complete
MTVKKKLLIVANVASENTNALADTAVRGANHPNIENIEVKYTAPLQAVPND